MRFVADVAIPLIVIFMMTVVGLDLTPADFRRVLASRWVVPTTLAAQVVALPLAAALIARVLDADAALTMGLILVAACPIAAMSNYYAFLARANVPLAVTLTGFSSLLAPVITPFAASTVVAWLLTSHVAIHLPVGPMMRQLLIGLVLPIVLGMLIRHFAPNWTARRQPLLTRLSLVAVAVLLIYVLADQIATIAQGLRQLVLAAALFSGIAVGSGYALGWALSRGRSDRTCIAIGFNTRNLGAAIMIASTVLGRLDFVGFAAVFFVVQLGLIGPILLWSRRRTCARLEEGDAETVAS
jgi:bile acid:Na+ symporter, BASS family